MLESDFTTFSACIYTLFKLRGCSHKKMIFRPQCRHLTGKTVKLQYDGFCFINFSSLLLNRSNFQYYKN